MDDIIASAEQIVNDSLSPIEPIARMIGAFLLAGFSLWIAYECVHIAVSALIDLAREMVL